MDYLVDIIVRFFVFLSRFAPALSKLGLISYRRFSDLKTDPKLHILLVGYNGVRNTGSDVRVAEIARQIESRLDRDHAEVSVMTLDEENIGCYFDAGIRLIHFTTIFFWGLFKACCASQAVVLCEGSTLKSKFANALTLYMCEAAGIMKTQRKPCIAYGSEAGEMDGFLERAARKLCAGTYFIARSQNSLDRIRGLGFEGNLGTDAAWEFDSGSRAEWADEALRQSGWDGRLPLLGVAPINPFCWPVKPSLTKWIRAKITGDSSRQFQLWYFFSWSKQRKMQYENYIDSIARAVNGYAAKNPCRVVILGMERLDADACGKLESRLKNPASVFLSSDHDGYEMTAILRRLSALVTSRYHARVLSMEAGVPAVAVSMDERLDNIMQEMDMGGHQLIHADDPDLAHRLTHALEFTHSHGEQIREKTGRSLTRYKETLDEMGDFLIKWLLLRKDELS